MKYRRGVPGAVLPVAVLLAGMALPARAQDATVPPGVVYEQDVRYGTAGDVPLLLDMARPESDGPHPVVVMIHGGAWRSGNKNWHTPQILELASRGYAAVTVAYRFCPEHRFPAQVEDVKCAVRFLRAHQEEYDLDPERIGAVGFSAGAHLAMMLGVMDEDDGLEGDGGWQDRESRVQAVVSFFGPTDLLAPQLPDVSRRLLRDFLGGDRDEQEAAYRRASPVTYVTEDDAPMLLFQGTQDPLVPHQQAWFMVESLTEADVPGRVEILVGAGHGWSGEELERTWSATLEFLEQYLEPQAPDGDASAR